LISHNHQVQNESDTWTESEGLAETVDESQDTNPAILESDEPVVTVPTEPSPDRLFIPAGISQTELAAGLAGFFESNRYTSASLLKTCLWAMDRMTVRMDVSEIKNTIDALYRPQDSRDDDCDTAEATP